MTGVPPAVGPPSASEVLSVAPPGTVPGRASDAEPAVFVRLRRVWLAATIAIAVGSFAAAIGLAPPAGAEPGRALSVLLLFGYAAHVASTGWFATLPEVRAHAGRHRGRFVAAPLALVAGAVVAACALPPVALQWALLPYFAWQFVHFQRQNLGLAALAAAAQRAGALTSGERRALAVAGIGGVGGLLTHHQLLGLAIGSRLDALTPLAAAVFLGGAAGGLLALAGRDRRPGAFVAVYVFGLLFFAPVFLFDNAYAAVAGLTIAHSWQYLLVMGHLARAPRPGRSPLVAPAALLGICVVGGLLLASIAARPASSALLGRAMFGVYAGVVMAHFVVDAGMWRMRDEFPRRFLTAKLPYLVGRRPA